jgi:hypothetical protein
LKGKFLLVGVVMLEGVVPGEMHSGAHYHSFFRTEEGDWFVYDDLMGFKRVKQTENFTKTIFNFNSSNAPVMYFYERVSDDQLEYAHKQPKIVVDYDEEKLTITKGRVVYFMDSKEELRKKLGEIYEEL